MRWNFLGIRRVIHLWQNLGLGNFIIEEGSRNAIAWASNTEKTPMGVGSYSEGYQKGLQRKTHLVQTC